jgi:hypothetical protein
LPARPGCRPFQRHQRQAPRRCRAGDAVADQQPRRDDRADDGQRGAGRNQPAYRAPGAAGGLGCDDAHAPARQRFDPVRVAAQRPERGPDLAQQRGQAGVEIDHALLAPDRACQRLAVDHPAFGGEQRGEQIGRLRPQPDGLAAGGIGQRAVGRVEAEAVDRVAVARHVPVRQSPKRW